MHRYGGIDMDILLPRKLSGLRAETASRPGGSALMGFMKKVLNDFCQEPSYTYIA
jgi:hypothetical protein